MSEVFLALLDAVLVAVLPVILDWLQQVLTTMLLTVGLIAINWWKNLLIDAWIRNIVEQGILSAQEELWNEVGSVKFEEAKKYIVPKLNKWYIRISEEELDVRIQSVVKILKAEFGDYWYNNPSKDAD